MNTQFRLDELSRQVSFLQKQVTMLTAIVYQQRVVSTFLLYDYSPTSFLYVPPAYVRVRSGPDAVVHLTPTADIITPSIKKMYDHTIIASSLVA